MTDTVWVTSEHHRARQNPKCMQKGMVTLLKVLLFSCDLMDSQLS